MNRGRWSLNRGAWALNRGALYGLAASLLVAFVVAGCGKETGTHAGHGGAPAESGSVSAGGAAQGGSARESGQARAGAYRLSVENRPGRPIVGDNTLVVAMTDSSGRPVTRVPLRILVAMPAMGAMPRMESRATAEEVRPGVYQAKYGIGMPGDWTMTVVAGPQGSESSAEFRLSTGSEGLEFLGSEGVAAEGSIGAVTLDATRRQAIGVRTEAVQVRRLTVPIRAAGRVAYDETRRAEISLKFSGWVREIRVDYTGQMVRAGTPLLSVYSPELLTAQQEYLGALDSDLVASARQRLLLWDVAPEQIDEIAKTGKPMDSVPILAPVSGVVIEKSVVQGSAFVAGQTLYKIAPVDPVWVIASVYQYELPLVRVGMRASVIPPFQSQETRGGVVSYINPYLDPDTRTGEVRIQIANPRGDLKPGMFVDVSLERELGERLAVPEGAVIFAGDRRVVFVDLGDGRLEPRDVTVGPKAGDYYEIVGGLKAGDVVVTSGNFLIAAESRLQSAARGE